MRVSKTQGEQHVAVALEVPSPDNGVGWHLRCNSRAGADGRRIKLEGLQMSNTECTEGGVEASGCDVRENPADTRLLEAVDRWEDESYVVQILRWEEDGGFVPEVRFL